MPAAPPLWQQPGSEGPPAEPYAEQRPTFAADTLRILDALDRNRVILPEDIDAFHLIEAAQRLDEAGLSPEADCGNRFCHTCAMKRCQRPSR